MKTVSSVRGNIIANFAGKAWAGIFSLAFVPLYIRLMGVEVYGLLGIFMSLSALLSLLDMGLSATLSRELSRLSVQQDSAQESRNLVRTFEVIYWGIGILIGIVVIVLVPIITSYWITSTTVSSEVVEQALLIMGVSLIFQWPATLYSGGLMGLQRQVELNVIRSVSVTVQHVGAVLVLLFISPSIVIFFAWQAFVGLMATIALAIWLWKGLPKAGYQARFDKQLLARNWRFASGVMGISAVTILLTQLDKIILSKMLTLEMFGYYMLAFSVANALHNLVTPLFSALFPRFAQLVVTEDESKLIVLYHKGCQLLAALVLPAAITIIIFSEEILVLWLGNNMAARNSYQILALLMFGTVLNALMTLPYALQLAYGWTRLAIYKNIVAVVVLVPLMVWMVQTYQGVGAAWVWIILNLGYVLFEVPVMHRRLLKTEMVKWYWRDLIMPFIIVTSIVLMVRVALPEDASRLITFILVIISLALSYIASAWFAGYLNLKMLQVNRP